jgi:hypothetical protein
MAFDPAWFKVGSPNIGNADMASMAAGTFKLAVNAGPPIDGTGAQAGGLIRSVLPVSLGAMAGNIVIPFAFRVAYAAGASPGTPDDVLLTLGLTFNVVVFDVAVYTGTGIAVTSAQLRSATGGGGVALSQALSTAASNTTTRETTRTGGNVVNASTPLYWRRSDQGVSGTVVVWCHP